MVYDNMHRITSKSQHLTQDNVLFNGTLNVGYDLTYTYGTEAGKKFQLASVKDVNYRTEETPGENNVENNHVYTYDKNGNLVYVNTGRLMNDGHNETGTGERKLIWDEENRLLAVDDNGLAIAHFRQHLAMLKQSLALRSLARRIVSNYWYDADGERAVKISGGSDQVYVNGVFSGGSTNTAKFSLYVSPYLVANQGGRYTKHIYAGAQRIVSKIGDFASYGSDPRRIEYAGANTDGLSVDYKAKYAAQQQVIKDNYKFFDVPYNGTDNDNYADGEGFCCNDGSMEAAVAQARKAQARAVVRSFKDPDNYENLQFFYHPDHLGSSSFITNLEGEVVQHIEYVPFGEVFIEERNNVWNTPYLFNAKEFDEETGMYYYGARYYEPRLSLWMSTDRYEEKYPYISTYSYSLCNPMKVMDVHGDSTVVVVSGYGQKVGPHIMYDVNVYRNMSLEEFQNLNSSNNLPTPDYNMMLARDAHDLKSSKEPVVVHSDKRYGKNNECPPGTYYLSPKGNSGGSYELYLEDKIGTRTIHGPDGDRKGIAIHQYSPNDSQGCLTTCSGRDTGPVKALIKAIPDLNDPSQPVRIILMPREVTTGKYVNSANGSIKYTGVEHIWNGGTLAPITVTPNNRRTP